MKYKAIIAIPIFILLSACTQVSGEMGIFYSLSVEQVIDNDDATFDELTVHSLVPTAELWLVAGGKGYTVDSSTKSATAMTLPSGMDYCSQLAERSGEIYGLFTDDETSTGGVYLWSDGSWTVISAMENLAAELSVKNIVAANNVLFLSCSSSSDTYSFPIYTYDGSLLQDTGETSPYVLTDAAWDGTDYWFSGSGKLLKGSADLTVFSLELEPSSNLITGVHFSSADNSLYCTSEDGYVYQYIAGTWTAFDQITVDDSVIKLFDLHTVSTAGTDYLLAGSNNGIYKYDADSDTFTALSTDDTVISDTNYTNTSLETSTISGFTDDGTFLFAFTSQEGLWYRELNTDSIWSRL